MAPRKKTEPESVPQQADVPDAAADDKKKRAYVSQADVPSVALEDALKIPQALADQYAKQPTKPLSVAAALKLQPGSSAFRMLCGAAVAYGLTEGGAFAPLIGLTDLGRRIVAPTLEGDDATARREALLRPRVINGFLTRYRDSKVPAANIARNVLIEMGVPQDKAEATFLQIMSAAAQEGLIREVSGAKYVDLDGAARHSSASGDPQVEDPQPYERSFGPTGTQEASQDQAVTDPLSERGNDRVFITHGKNKAIVAQLKELLSYGKFTPVIAVEGESGAKPVPDKVLDEMRTCSAAIIHAGSEIEALDREGNALKFLNQNVLIEIGAALALYGRRFILLVEQGTTLPSNLQGLYEVRYEGDRLDYEATMKLLRAFSDFRD